MSEPTKQRRWWDDAFARHEVIAQMWWLGIPVVVIALLAGVFLLPLRWIKSRAAPQVVAYTSQDQVYSEPIFRLFEEETGIRVRAVYDSEAVKTVGLANRLLAERRHPQCDVFWNNEELRTRQLAAQNVFRLRPGAAYGPEGETNGWVATGFRTRRIVVNTNLLPLASAPQTLTEMTNAAWGGKVALAYPLFGTTATHFMALRQRWGDAAWQSWCRALLANKPFLVDGNSVVVKLVGRGEALVGLTDSDDVIAGQREGLPVADLLLREDGLLVHNTVGVIRGARHPEAAQKLFEFLQSTDVYERLKAAGAVEDRQPAQAGASRPAAELSAAEWNSLLEDLDETTQLLKDIFLR